MPIGARIAKCRHENARVAVAAAHVTDPPAAAQTHGIGSEEPTTGFAHRPPSALDVPRAVGSAVVSPSRPERGAGLRVAAATASPHLAPTGRCKPIGCMHGPGR